MWAWKPRTGPVRQWKPHPEQSKTSGTAENYVLTAQPKSADLSKSASAVSSLAKNVGEGLKENLPAAKEIAGDILHSMVTVLSQLLNAAAELLRK